MAPARSSARLGHLDQNNIQRAPLHDQDSELNANPELFIDPMLGTPLAMYIEKDVEDKDMLIVLISVSSCQVVDSRPVSVRRV